jgi:hypothetical protein
MNVNKTLGIAFILVGIGLVVWAGFVGEKEVVSTLSPTPPWQAEPLVPTAPPPAAIANPALIAMPSFVEATIRLPPPPNAHQRFGVGVPNLASLKTEAAQALGPGWYLTWSVLETPPGPAEAEFWQMIRVNEDGFRPDANTIRSIATSRPGMTWLVGNEPDVIWQDNVTPARYAELYHDLYALLKATDPAAQVAIGGISQPTPLRLQYLELALSAYQSRYGQEMPVDIWNIHNFILREERDSWGVEIPPGLPVDRGLLLELEDHDDIDRFKAQIIAFRQWLAERGQRNKPLVVSEYGILMPTEYGFDFERVKRFMYGSYDFMLTATDEAIGYPADDNRLVQRWAWYSLSDKRYATGNLIDRERGKLTELGKAHQKYIAELPLK